MNSTAQARPPGAKFTPARSASSVGALLRDWRTSRSLSQLDLSLDAGISARHLSYIETGRAHPSREMIARLAEALQIPLRDRNPLLLAAGFAPMYPETSLAAPELAQVHRAVQYILRQQEPFPALVHDRHWNVKMMNTGCQLLLHWLFGDREIEPNALRFVLQPDGLRRYLANWEEVAQDMIAQTHRQVAASPADEVIRALLAEVLAYPDVPSRWGLQNGAHTAPLLTTTWRKGDQEFRFFTTWTTFGTPHNVTLDELRIECSFPADGETESDWRRLMKA
jgi:transcriptional regulator with XRE-family HTH domain